MSQHKNNETKLRDRLINNINAEHDEIAMSYLRELFQKETRPFDEIFGQFIEPAEYHATSQLVCAKVSISRANIYYSMDDTPNAVLHYGYAIGTLANMKSSPEVNDLMNKCYLVVSEIANQ